MTTQTSVVHPNRASKLQPLLQHTSVSSSSVEQSRIPILSHLAVASEKDDVRRQSGRWQSSLSLITPQQLTVLFNSLPGPKHSSTCVSPFFRHPSAVRWKTSIVGPAVVGTGVGFGVGGFVGTGVGGFDGRGVGFSEG